MVAPPDSPVTIPVVAPTVAITIVDTVHVPPVVASVKVIEDDTHTESGPAIAAGAAFTVAMVVT